jgi:ribosome-binding ATPase YchF (GTP1/OBG family)
MSDIEYLERRLTKLRREVKGDPSRATELFVAESTLKVLNEGQLSSSIPEEIQVFASGQNLLSFKPLLIVVNIGEEEITRPDPVPGEVREYAKRRGVEVIPICAKLEAELSGLSPEEEKAFLSELGIEERGLSRVIRSGYRLLRLLTFFTTGPEETRAWTVPEGTPAIKAGGKIHSDFERGFIRAEVVSYEDFVRCRGWQNARSSGKVRLEGREYPIQDGDIVYFRFAV